MKKLNRKGFTIIESIITFAILAIAGVMFLTLFSNVSTLMKEGSFIKTESDEMYNQLVSQSVTDESGTQADIQFKVGNQNYKQEVFVQSQTGKVEDFDMKLSRFVTGTQQVEWLPNNDSSNIPGGGEEVTEKYIDAEFKFLKNMTYYPYDKNSIWAYKWAFNSSNETTISNAISDKIIKELDDKNINDGLVSIYDDLNINQYIINEPNDSQINTVINQFDDNYYKKFLKDGYEVKWIAIDCKKDWNGVINKINVYGVLFPQGSMGKKISIKFGDKKFYFDTIPSNFIENFQDNINYTINYNYTNITVQGNQVYSYLENNLPKNQYVYIEIIQN